MTPPPVRGGARCRGKALLGGKGGGCAEVAQGGGVPAGELTAVLADLPRVIPGG
ncbi:hypothetical protein ACFVW2_13015 [Streptomyces sp. NPDC058171]